MERLLKIAHTRGELAFHIIEKAKTFGASLAGLANIASVLDLPSYRTYRNDRWSAERLPPTHRAGSIRF